MIKVSIILPTYNRSPFLGEAFDSICGQSWTDWELIVVDDGSMDETREMVAQLSSDFSQPTRYVYQQNLGTNAARNTGLDNATGKYVAFFDSDDIWLAHHLKNCVEELESNPDVDWVYGACRILNHATGEVLAPSTFYVDGKARPFLRLKTRTNGVLHIIEDSSVVECQITHGLYCGLQNSVLRRALFQDKRFESASRNEAEDQLFTLSSLRHGCRLAFIDRVHVDYRIHDGNSSAVGNTLNNDKTERVLRLLVAGYERMLAEPNWTLIERRALYRRLNREYFWNLGYATLWMSGRRREALQMFRQGLRYWPWDWRCWKTYLLKRLLVGI